MNECFIPRFCTGYTGLHWAGDWVCVNMIFCHIDLNVFIIYDGVTNLDITRTTIHLAQMDIFIKDLIPLK